MKLSVSNGLHYEETEYLMDIPPPGACLGFCDLCKSGCNVYWREKEGTASMFLQFTVAEEVMLSVEMVKSHPILTSSICRHRSLDNPLEQQNNSKHGKTTMHGLLHTQTENWILQTIDDRCMLRVRKMKVLWTHLSFGWSCCRDSL